MFSKSGGSDSKSKSASKKPSSKKRGKGGEVQLRNPFLGVNDKDMSAREMTANSEREVYKFDYPTQELGLTDLISKHKAGDRFQYLAITGNETETTEARMSRLFNFRPKARTSMIPINELPHIRLRDDTEEFPLTDVIPKKCEDYVHVVSVTGYYASLTSVTSSFSKAKCSIMDTRYHPPHEVQFCTFNTNLDGKIELSMDYCVPKESVDRINLVIIREQATITHGEQWGALQLQIQIEQTSFPFQSPLKTAAGVLAPTASAIEDFQVNPNGIDITMTMANLPKIREMYQDGDIADVGEEVVFKTKKNTYAKSSIRALPKGGKAESSGLVRPGFEFMKDFRKPEIDAGIASVSVISDDEDDIDVDAIQTSREQWEKQQEEMRRKQEQLRIKSGVPINHDYEIMSDTTEEITRPEFPKSAMRKASSSTYNSMSNFEDKKFTPEQQELLDQLNGMRPESGSDDSKTKSKGVRFGASEF